VSLFELVLVGQAFAKDIPLGLACQITVRQVDRLRRTLTRMSDLPNKEIPRIDFYAMINYVLRFTINDLRFTALDYSLSFLAGLFGSMHCVGMCGAIVMGYSTQGFAEQTPPSSALASHLTYNSGRVLSYAIIGGIVGGLGAGITTLQDIAFWFSVVAGVLLLLLGISLLRILPGFATSAQLVLESRTRNLLFRVYQAVYGSLIAQKGLESKFYIGLLTPLLPCGLLYSMFLKAASTASVLQGALVMACFGAGIVPALVATGFASSYFGNKLRYWGDKLAAVTVLLMGLVLLWRAFGVPGMEGHGH